MVVGGALDIRRCTNLRRSIYDCIHFPINFTAALPMDVYLIWSELVDEIRVELHGHMHPQKLNRENFCR